MAIQAPTRITIEIHPAEPASGEPLDGATAPPVVRVTSHAGASASQPVVLGTPRDDVALPAAYEPGPCLCLDDEDCGADHGND